MRKSFVLAVAVSLLVCACSKKSDNDNNPGPDPNPGANNNTAALNRLYANLQGKWGFSNIILQARQSAAIKASTKFNRMGGLHIQARAADDKTGYIEFTTDSTFLLEDGEGKYYTGKYSLKDSTTAELKGLGTLTKINFSQNAISFTLNYGANGAITAAVTGTKATAVATDDRTKSLCRLWYLTAEENGKDFIGQETEIYDQNGNLVETFILDSLTYRATIYGTYVVEQYSKKVLKQSSVMNWKWHPTNSERFLYWDSNYDQGGGEVLIRSFKDNVLKLSDYYDPKESPDEHDDFTLKSVY